MNSQIDILKQIKPVNKGLMSEVYHKTGVQKAMTLWAYEVNQDLRAKLEKALEYNAEQNSFAAASAEEEMRQKMIQKFSDMIFEALPSGEMSAFDLIKILKQLKTDVEAL